MQSKDLIPRFVFLHVEKCRAHREHLANKRQVHLIQRQIRDLTNHKISLERNAIKQMYINQFTNGEQEGLKQYMTEEDLEVAYKLCKESEI